MLYVFRWNFWVKHWARTIKSDLLKLNLCWYIIIYRNMKSVKDLGKLIKQWRQFYYFNFSHKEHLEMLFVLHIRLFPMSYDSGGMSLGDSEINYDFFWSFMTFDFWSNYSTLYVIYKCQNICIKNQVIYLLKSNTLLFSKPSKDIYYIYIHNIYYIYMVCVFVCIFYLKQFVFLWGSPRKILTLPPAGLVTSRVRKLLLGLTPKNFLKFEIFPGESSSPNRATETGYLYYPFFGSCC